MNRNFKTFTLLIGLLFLILGPFSDANAQSLNCDKSEVEVCCKGIPGQNEVCECKKKNEKPLCQEGCQLRRCSGGGKNPEVCMCHYKKCRRGGTPVCDEESQCICQKPDLEITRVQSLRFGTMTMKASGGSVTINAQTGVRTITGDIFGLGSDYYRAEFEVTGPPNTPFSVDMPKNVDMPGHGTAKVKDLNYYFPKDPPTTDRRGRATIYVGGTMGMKGKDMEGDYEGVFDITVTPLK